MADDGFWLSADRDMDPPSASRCPLRMAGEFRFAAHAAPAAHHQKWTPKRLTVRPATGVPSEPIWWAPGDGINHITRLHCCNLSHSERPWLAASAYNGTDNTALKVQFAGKEEPDAAPCNTVPIKGERRLVH